MGFPYKAKSFRMVPHILKWLNTLTLNGGPRSGIHVESWDKGLCKGHLPVFQSHEKSEPTSTKDSTRF